MYKDANLLLRSRVKMGTICAAKNVLRRKAMSKAKVTIKNFAEVKENFPLVPPHSINIAEIYLGTVVTVPVASPATLPLMATA